MKKWKLIFPLALVAIACVAFAGAAFADSDDDGHEGDGHVSLIPMGKKSYSGKPHVAKVVSERYKKECGSCHFAYQPGLLPAKSWEKIMSGLADHFGDNAEVDKEQAAWITDYLVKNSADKSDAKASVKILNSLKKGDAPIRISSTPYFVHEHRGIPLNVIRDNPKVKSLAHCQRCHTRADLGNYSEHEVVIPNMGKWRD